MKRRGFLLVPNLAAVNSIGEMVISAHRAIAASCNHSIHDLQSRSQTNSSASAVLGLKRSSHIAQKAATAARRQNRMTKFNSLTKAGCLFLLLAATAITLPAQTFTTLHSFDGTDGNNSQAALVQATDGNLYGSTVYAGANGVGTIYKMTTSGTATLVTSFDGANGSSPWNALVQGTDGNLYGTANYGGADHDCSGGCGVVYKTTLAGAITTLHSFDGTDGVNPQEGLVLGSNGDLYGLTLFGGDGYGTVFNINASGKLTTLHNFVDGTDGGYPYPAMIQATDGNFYGTTYTGGAYDEGTVFRLTPGGTLTTIYSFCPDGNLCTDGAEPVGGLVEGNDGNLYGVAAHGANQICGCGTIFRLSLSGTFTTLHSFNGTDGNGSWSRMVQGTDGNFYGVTTYGGTS
ncbi:MAG: choice-of-anchor tandem repeat GloVer-containing protein, partial [Candidatus Sulfotelmatobacter sp.]